MKNIIIGGTVRAGKSTLANMLRKRFSYSKVESDTIVNAFDKVFPELGIIHDKPAPAREKYEPFLFEILNGFCKDLKYAQNITVFPGAQFLPENIARYEKLDKYIVIFLGVNAETPEELREIIREHDNEHDWTYSKTDEWMLRFCRNIIEESEKIKSDCEKYGFHYFNTVYEREKVLNQICDMVEELQNNN